MTMMRKLVILLLPLLWALMLAACGRSGPARQPSSATTPPPGAATGAGTGAAASQDTAGRITRSASDPACRRTLDDATAAGKIPRLELISDTIAPLSPETGCRVAVGTKTITISFMLPSQARKSEVRAGLETGAQKPESVRWRASEEGVLDVRFAPGPAGQAWDVRLKNVPTAGGGRTTLALRLTRVAEPTVAVLVYAASGEMPILRPLEVLPPPGEVLFRFSKEMDRGSVEQALDHPTGRGQLKWLDDRTLRWTPPAERHRIEWNFQDSRTRDLEGVQLSPVAAGAFWVGAPPQLVMAEQPGRERPLRGLPPDILQVTPRYDRLAVTVAYFPTPSAPQVLILPVGKGEDRVAPPGSPLGWTPDGRLVLVSPTGGFQRLNPVTGQSESFPAPPVASPALSPDGRRVAGLEAHAAPDSADTPLLKVDLVIYDLVARRALLFPMAIASPARPPRPGQTLPLTWTRDGKKVVLFEAVPIPDGGWQAELVAIDATSGEKQNLARTMEGFNPWNTSLSWSPSGRFLAAGGAILDARVGRWMEIGLQGDRFWHPREDRLLANREAWGEVVVYDVANARTEAFGRGLAAGWSARGRPLIIRWPDSAERWQAP